MLKNLKTTGASSRDGVALILVLGFLSLLLILAVAFASNMRVERMATRNFSDQPKCSAVFTFRELRNTPIPNTRSTALPELLLS